MLTTTRARANSEFKNWAERETCLHLKLKFYYLCLYKICFCERGTTIGNSIFMQIPMHWRNMQEIWSAMVRRVFFSSSGLVVSEELGNKKKHTNSLTHWYSIAFIEWYRKIIDKNPIKSPPNFAHVQISCILPLNGNNNPTIVSAPSP